MEQDLKYGDLVTFMMYGTVETRGTVREVYGRPPRVRVVLDLTPGLSGEAVADPTTISLPIERVHRVAGATA